jgi:hypothetical protein
VGRAVADRGGKGRFGKGMRAVRRLAAGHWMFSGVAWKFFGLATPFLVERWVLVRDERLFYMERWI